MPPLPTRQGQQRGVHTMAPTQCDCNCTHCTSSPGSDTSWRNLRSPPSVGVEKDHATMQVGGGVVMMAVPLPVIPTLHTVLTYFVFDWDVRAAQFPNLLPKDARRELAFPGFPFPWPNSLTVWFETPFGLVACAITPLERDGKLIPITVGRVLACISRDLYAPIQPTSPYAGHTLLPAVRHAMASRTYDPEPYRKKRVPRIVDLYPARAGSPLFFWGIHLQHWGGLVARFGYNALNVA